MPWLDFHIHTYHSDDSLMKPEKILKLAHERGLDGIVVSDHNTIAGGLECRAKNKYPGLEVIVASEIKTNLGEITGVNLKEEITERNFSDVVAQIKKQGGLVLLVHPYLEHKLDEVNFDAIDLIEGFNSRVPNEDNRKAQELARKHNKPIIAGSDAHMYGEIATGKTEYSSFDDLLKPLSISCQRNKASELIISQFIRGFKRKNPKMLYKTARWMPGYLYRRAKGV